MRRNQTNKSLLVLTNSFVIFESNVFIGFPDLLSTIKSSNTPDINISTGLCTPGIFLVSVSTNLQSSTISQYLLLHFDPEFTWNEPT